MRALFFSIFLLSTIAAAQSTPSQREQRMLFLLNLERKHNNLPPLAWDSHNAAAAHGHAQLILQHSELSHRYEGEQELAERLASAGARFDTAAENLALADNEEDAHAALMYSPGHRANILNGGYNAVGVSVAEQGNRIYVVQVFSHRLPEYSDDEFQRSFLNAVNRDRKERGLRPLAEHEDKFAHGDACSADGGTTRLPAPASQRSSVSAFTASDPDHIPEGLQKYVEAADFHWITVGACFRPGPKYGYGNFWVVVAFGS